MGRNLKYQYCVAILRDDNTLSYVTSVDNSTKTFHCEAGKEAKKFSRTTADDLQYGMIVNYCSAVVIKAPDSFNLINSKKEGE